MTPRSGAAAELRRARRDIRQDRAALAERAAELAGAPPPERLSAVALALHFDYTAFEAFLERTLRCLDGD
jgi:hypothetical protein